MINSDFQKSGKGNAEPEIARKITDLQSHIYTSETTKELPKLIGKKLGEIGGINFAAVRIGDYFYVSKPSEQKRYSLDKFDRSFSKGTFKSNLLIENKEGIFSIRNRRNIVGYIFILCDDASYLKTNKKYFLNLSKTINVILKHLDKETSLIELNSKLQKCKRENESKLKNTRNELRAINTELKKTKVLFKKLELETNQRRERFRRIVERAPEPIFIQTEKKFSYLNQAACRLFKIKDSSQLIGTPILNRIHPDYRELINNRIKEVNEHKKTILNLTEMQFIRIDGSEVWVETAVQPIRYKGSNGGLVFARNISDRKEIRKALEESEERWQFALEGAGDGVWDWNVKTDKVYFSTRWKSMLGYKDNELKNTFSEWEKRVHPQDIEKASIEIKKHFAGITDSYVVEHRLLCKDGNYKWILARGKIIKRDKEGNPLRFIGTHADINDKKLAEINLEFFRFGIDHTQIGVYQIEEDGTILYANKEAIRNLGYTHDELIGKSLFEIDTSLSPRKFKRHRNSLRTEGSRTFTSIHKRKDGSQFPVEITVNYIEFRDNLYSFSFAKDITERVAAEESLRQSRENLSITLHSIGDAVISTDIKGNIALMNPVAEKLCGWKFSEAEGNPISRVFTITNTQTGKPVDNPVKLVLKSGKKIGLSNHTVLISKDGKEYQVAASAAPIFDKTKKITGAVLVFSDVTEEYKIRETLKENEANLTKAELIGNFGNWELDLNTLKIKGSKGAAVVYGMPPKNWDLKTVQKFSLPKYRKMMDDALNLLVSKGIPYKVEFEIKRPDGEIRVINSTATYNAKMNKVFGVLHDITKRKRAEEALARSEQIYREFFTKDLTGDFLATIEGKILECNPAYLRILGYKSIEEIQKYSSRKFYVDPREREEMIELIKKEKEVTDYEMHMLRTDGKKITVVENIIGVFDDKNNLTHLKGYLFDITDRKKAEQEMLAAKEKAEVADHMKTEFLAQMSHEIRSPLNAVLSLTGLIKDITKEIPNEDLQVCFSGIDSASKRIIRTVDSILNMSDLQLGTYQVTKRKTNIVELLQNLVREYENIAQNKNVDLLFNSPLKKADVVIDDYALNQVFANLIDNAVKYTRQGFVEIRLNVDKKIKVEIEDTGIGIAKEFLPLIFSPFSQEKQGYTREYEGNGLGMSLVKNYCDLIGAEISVISKKDSGTTFTVII